MEIGNAVFGNSRGEYPVPREKKFEFQIDRLLDAVRAKTGRDDGWYGQDFENAVFETHPYYWGDCTCGYEQKENDWCDANKHRAECYQNRVTDAIRAEGFDPDITTRPPEVGEAFRKAEDRIRRKLCKELGLTYPRRCAVHCTCDYEIRWSAFRELNCHSPRCPVVLPNWHHKPTGFTLMWYKYPLRDSYCSEPPDADKWRKMVDDCITSLGFKP